MTLASSRARSSVGPTSRGARDLVSDVDVHDGRRRTRSRTTSVPRRAGATASRSPRGTSSSPTTRCARSGASSRCGRGSRTRRSAASRRSMRRRSGSSCARVSPAGAACSRDILPSHALRGEDLAKVWRDRIDNPKTGRPIGSGPFLVESWERGKQLTFVRNPRYWGPHPRTSTGSSSASATSRSDRRRAGRVDARAARSTSSYAGASARASVQELRRRPARGRGARRSPRCDWEHLDIRVGRRAGTPRSSDKLVRQALAYGIDRVALARALCAQIDPRYRAERQRRVPDAESLTTSRTGARYRRDRARGAGGCSSRRAAGGGRTASTSATGERLSLRFATLAGNRASASRRSSSSRRQLRQVGIEVVPDVRATECPLRPDPPERRLRPRPLSMDRVSGLPRRLGGRLRLRTESRTTRATASGSSRETSTRPSGSSTGAAGARAEPSGRTAGAGTCP